MAKPYEMGTIRTDRGEFIDKGNYAQDVLHPDFMDGADPTGVRDSTKAIQAALNAAAADDGTSQNVIIPPGTYRIGYWTGGTYEQGGAVVTLDVPSNVHLWVQHGATLLANHEISVANGYPYGWVDRGIIESSGTGVSITLDGVLDGQRSLNPDGRIYGIYLKGVERCRVQGSGLIRDMPANPAHTPNPSGNGGDGIVIYASGGVGTESTDVVVTGITVSNVARSAFSLLGCRNVKLVNVTATDTSTHQVVGNPGTGIDLEPDNVLPCEDIQIIAPYLENNYMGISCSPHSRRVSIVAPVCRNNRQADIIIRSEEGGVEVTGGVIHNPKNHAIIAYQTCDLRVTGTHIVGTAADVDPDTGAPAPDTGERSHIKLYDVENVYLNVHLSHSFQSAVEVGQSNSGSAAGSRNITIEGTATNCVYESQRSAHGVISIFSDGATKQVFDVDMSRFKIRDSRTTGTTMALRGVYVASPSAAEKDTYRYPAYISGPTNKVGGDTGGLGAHLGRAVSVAFSSIAAGALGSVDVTVAGAETTDGVLANPRGSLGTNFMHVGTRVKSAGVVTLDVRNNGGSSGTPSTQSWTFTLFKNSS